MAWQTAFLFAAGALASFVGAVHGVLGETKVFAHSTIEPARTRKLPRAIWLCSAVAWMGGGVLLASLAARDARRWIVLVFAVIYAPGIVGNTYVSRGRHIGWMLSAAVVLPLAGI